jgi:hypothetical protein
LQLFYPWFKLASLLPDWLIMHSEKEVINVENTLSPLWQAAAEFGEIGMAS